MDSSIDMRLFELLYTSEDVIEYRLLSNNREHPPISFFVPGGTNLNGNKIDNERYNVYFGVNPREGKSKSKIKRIVACYTDVDSKNFVSQEAYQTHLNAKLDYCASLRIPPTVRVNTGHGQHWYWILSENPEILTKMKGGKEYQESPTWTKTQKMLQGFMGGDSVFDPPRILRVPGTMNIKDTPVRCEIIEITGGEYKLPDFDILHGEDELPPWDGGAGADDVSGLQKKVVEVLSQTAGVCDDYADFIRLALAFKSAGYQYADVDVVFRGSANYNPENNRKIYDGLKPSRITMKTAYYYAVKHNPTEMLKATHQIREAQTQEAVQTQQEESPERPEKKKNVELPLDKIHPKFFEFWGQFDGHFEVAKEAVLSSLLVAMGTALGNKTTLKICRGLRPNLYLVIVGLSSFMKKTTAMDLGLAYLEALSEQKKAQYQQEIEAWEAELGAANKKDKREILARKPQDRGHIYPAEMSPEMLLKKMADKPDGLFAYSEMGSLLARLDGGYMAGFKEKLTDFFDGRGTTYRRETITGGCITVKDPCPSLIGCSTFQWLQEHLKESDLMSGFLARFVFVDLRTYPTVDVALPPYFAVNEFSPWMELFKELDKFDYTLTLSEEAAALYSDWYSRFKADAIKQDLFLHGFLSRLLQICHKVAMVNHAIDAFDHREEWGRTFFPDVIQARSYEQAFPWVEFFAESIKNCYDELTQGPNLKEIKAIEIIRRRGKREGAMIWLSQSKLCMFLNLSKKDMLEIIETLELKRVIVKMVKNKYVFWGLLDK